MYASDVTRICRVSTTALSLVDPVRHAEELLHHRPVRVEHLRFVPPTILWQLLENKDARTALHPDDTIKKKQFFNITIMPWILSLSITDGFCPGNAAPHSHVPCDSRRGAC
ncbi:hypothetical protein CCM_07018 [Cordyceps militaris CM01]|uniref:Uncharacterized protein n=1 Tax=Cordyceps militaris (strain CM01) TaxID=983644 RepID=G3JLM4_CORMM|nr:uncharacterized protein CCM_07018 [Cordyceps militaris CM01]EGX90598.1 hypothetical protein CCM_07018 [Cordyceps militaris CM01]